MIELRWEGDDEQQYLFAGSNESELAWLQKRNKLWSAAIWLPGIQRGREYNTLAAHKKHIEEKVQHWFSRALGDPVPLSVPVGTSAQFGRESRDIHATPAPLRADGKPGLTGDGS